MGYACPVVTDSHRDWNPFLMCGKEAENSVFGKPASAMRYRQSISRIRSLSLKQNPFRTDDSFISVHSSLLCRYGSRSFHGVFYFGKYLKDLERERW